MKFKGLLKQLTKGVQKGIPLVGQLKTEINNNKADKETGEGKINKARLAGFGSMILIEALLIFDVINLETAQKATQFFIDYFSS